MSTQGQLLYIKSRPEGGAADVTRTEKPEELVDTHSVTAKNTRNNKHEELVGTRRNETTETTRSDRQEELGGENANEEAKNTPPGESAKGK